MNPIWHSQSSVKQWGGKVEDYLPLHEKMDCSKAWLSDNRHRVLTHTMFWIKEVMIPIYGSYITLENGNLVSVKDICERHILEDYKMKFIPTPQDFIQEMEFKNWMQNGNGICPSAKKLYSTSKEVPETLIVDVVKLTEEVTQNPCAEIDLPSAPDDMVFDGKQGRPISSMILDGKQGRPKKGYGGKILD